MIKKPYRFIRVLVKKLFSYSRQYPLFAIALVAFIAGLALFFSGQTAASHWVLAIVASIEVLPLLWNMVRDVHEGSYGIDILAATAIISSVALKQYWPAIVIVLMLTGGQALEDYAEYRAKVELDALLSRKPKLAHRT